MKLSVDEDVPVDEDVSADEGVSGRTCVNGREVCGWVSIGESVGE